VPPAQCMRDHTLTHNSTTPLTPYQISVETRRQHSEQRLLAADVGQLVELAALVAARNTGAPHRPAHVRRVRAHTKHHNARVTKCDRCHHTCTNPPTPPPPRPTSHARARHCCAHMSSRAARARILRSPAVRVLHSVQIMLISTCYLLHTHTTQPRTPYSECDVVVAEE
jgi:Rieske Fe-S protein